MNMSQPEKAKPAIYRTDPLPHVAHVIAVASGKGGVGKSTLTVNLALMLQAMGRRVGVLDADIYGPSIPRMLGMCAQRQPEMQDGLMQPPVAHGLKTMSMGYITGDAAAIMRAPMITKALGQMLRMTAWGTPDAPLDVLLVDMPPGTGDVHLSMMQQVPVDGAVVITTPQEVATLDARKAVQMFQKLKVPLLGIVENMSAFTDAAGNKVALFGEGGGAALAEQAGCALLGQLPLDPALRACADDGVSYLEKHAGSDAANMLEEIAIRLQSKL
jgi:ATP-binding protein involved in chromosome partitioning